jgi:hypothetical protein
MYRIHKEQIPQKIAQKSITEYKDQLKRELQNPSLNAKQRKALKQRLKSVGCCRNYSKEKALDGAIKNK